MSTVLVSLYDEVAAAFAAGDHRGALDLVEQRWADEPDTALTALAQLLTEHGQNPVSARLIGRLASRPEASPHLLAHLAQLQWMSGDAAAAIATLRDCLTRHPQLSALYTQLGMIQLTAGQHFDALLTYAAAHSFDPKSAKAACGRACAFRLLTNERVVDVRLGGVTARFAVTGRSVSVDFIHLAGAFYEADELDALAAITPGGAVVADIGVNLGNHAIYFLRAFAPRDLHLFEPNPACLAALADNIAENPAPDTRVHTHRFGVGAAEGELFFNVHDDLNNGLVPVGSGHAERVPIRPLDAVLSHADLLKIDVEGMELEVLAGAKQLIAKSQPVIFIEVQERNRLAFAQWLNENSYVTHRLFPHGDYANVIALPIARSARTT